ncbi:MAG: aminoglycoside phosphotransferase family protein [Anaerolineales bacterium]
MNELPADFVNRVVSVYGPRGAAWLAELPARIDRIASLWDLKVEVPFAELHYHYVTAAVRLDGSGAVLKLAVPGVEIDREADCLRVYAGEGAPVLLAHDSNLGALLMERVRPGHNLMGLDEAQAIAVACGLMSQLHKPVGESAQFPTVADWGKGFGRLRGRFDGKTGPLPESLVAKAEGVFWDLESAMAPPVLLHGDLHHGNVLASDRQPWLAIDPQGVIGESAYEVGAFLRNPTPGVASRPDLRKLLASRVAMFSEIIDVDRRRIAGWGFAQAVLSAVWSVEDHGSGWGPALAVAEALRPSLG